MTAPTAADPATGGGFGIDHLPYGVFSIGGDAPRVGVRIGDQVLDAPAALPQWDQLLRQPSLNAFMAQGRETWDQVRRAATDYLSSGPDPAVMVDVGAVTLHLPIEVADYVDFYASEHHAANLGRLFRPDAEPLLPNWKHLPVGYHGRSGTVVVSGTDIHRPHGQRKQPAAAGPTFGPSERLDIEAEVGFVVGVGSPIGVPVAAEDFADHVFGVCLVNDWSARDIQAWEYVPLGPFLGKSFATSMSGWITPLSALAAARVPGPRKTVPVLDYLAHGDDWALDLRLVVRWNGTVVSRPPFAGMYWTPAQMLAHLTVNGASLRTGDLFASGTVSGAAADEVGSFIELTGGGKTAAHTSSGERTFLADGDEVVISATAPANGGGTLSLGEVRGRILG